MKKTLICILATLILSGCGTAKPVLPPTPTAVPETPIPTAAQPVTVTPADVLDLSAYAFPASIDPSKPYLFYLHGKIIEDQGIPAISPDFGEYEVAAILQKLSSFGFVVISEQRPKNTDSLEYSKKVTKQIKTLLNAGVPQEAITVVGASKGGGIAIFVSHFLQNEKVNFVIMSICHPDTVKVLMQDKTYLYGDILSIYDSTDELAGSCQEIFTFSEGHGIARHEEIVLHVGTGHGILYKPLDEWVIPAVEWAKGDY